MRSIRNKLFLGFGTLIFVLLVNIILTQIVSRQSTATYEKLKLEIGPTLTLLNEYQEVNRELLLLTINKILRQTDEQYNNRIKAITEVELPHFKTKVNLLKQALSRNDRKIQIANNLVVLTDSSINIVKYINNLLMTRADYDNPQTVADVAQKANLDLSDLSQQIDQNIALLHKEYSINFDEHQATLSKELENLSGIIFFLGLLGIVIGISISSGTINSIVRPIQILQVSARKISSGNYDIAVPIRGKDELASLGESFNTMAESLKKNFEEINLKNKELEQFVYIASHDLQEPLRTLGSFTELLDKEYPTKKGENSNTYLRFINESATRMSQLIKGLLDYSRIGEAKKVTDVDCNILIQGIKEDLSLAISKTQATLTIADLPLVKGYETELRLLFQNLISNAIKFHGLDKSPCISISVEKLPRFWKFAVKDNGIGIDAQHYERIFAIFQRLHNRSEYQGTGIGLAHCRKIVEMHGGKIWVESVPKVGSTFYFTISKKKL
ncbi:ATP-binding protein [uncultured Kriegella sp.]|uniref:sensor histidine kinase n=1 Tax=uncultured Kriegella sp. TaxID=1798910 RepID=UPI0030DC2A00